MKNQKTTPFFIFLISQAFFLKCETIVARDAIPVSLLHARLKVCLALYVLSTVQVLYKWGHQADRPEKNRRGLRIRPIILQESIV